MGRFNSLHQNHEFGIKGVDLNLDGENNRRKAFWRELQAMIRLRSPQTVNVYGAVTSRQGCYILVMELLPGGDLRGLLKNAAGPLTEVHSGQIVRDICAGMSFLHRKETIHGDLKSPNVLFDGAGRAKVTTITRHGPSKDTWCHHFREAAREVVLSKHPTLHVSPRVQLNEW